MPAVYEYDVEITQTVRITLAVSPSEALARALAELGITGGPRVTAVSVQRRGS